MSDTTERTPFNVGCAACGHAWTAAWLPMEASKFARVTTGVHCPNCGNGPEAGTARQPITVMPSAAPTKEKVSR